MSSIYENIRFAKDLVTAVRLQGLSTKEEDIVRAQDIFGKATIEELDELANDNGRVNSNGKPDKNGTWSSGRTGVQSTFYHILFHIWNWEDATRFYNQHTNPEYAELYELRKQNKKLTDKQAELARLYTRWEELENKKSELEEEEKKLREKIYNLSGEKLKESERADFAEAEIVRLKAKLYDLMVAKEEKR